MGRFAVKKLSWYIKQKLIFSEGFDSPRIQQEIIIIIINIFLWGGGGEFWFRRFFGFHFKSKGYFCVLVCDPICTSPSLFTWSIQPPPPLGILNLFAAASLFNISLLMRRFSLEILAQKFKNMYRLRQYRG